jgi:hypothetical protein
VTQAPLAGFSGTTERHGDWRDKLLAARSYLQEGEGKHFRMCLHEASFCQFLVSAADLENTTLLILLNFM